MWQPQAVSLVEECQLFGGLVNQDCFGKETDRHANEPQVLSSEMGWFNCIGVGISQDGGLQQRKWLVPFFPKYFCL